MNQFADQELGFLKDTWDFLTSHLRTRVFVTPKTIEERERSGVKVDLLASLHLTVGQFDVTA